MKHEPANPGPAGDFDTALRQRYADSASRLSARTQVQLHNRLRTALVQGSHANDVRRPAKWMLAAACSLVLVFAAGVRWQAGNDVTPDAASSPIAADDNGNSELVATLDETPDLYLWLGSDDAIAFASE